MRLTPLGNPNVHRLYTYSLVTGPATTPISLSEVKAFARLDASDTSEDTFLTLLIETAVDYAEKYTKREFINKTFITYREDWESSFELRRSKLQSITSIKYYSDASTLNTVSSSLYAHTSDTDFSMVYLLPENSWPSTTLYTAPRAIEITFVAGYGSSASDVPAALRRALLEHVLVLYENRGGCEDGSCAELLPKNVKALYKQYRINEINGNRGDTTTY